VTRFLSSEEGDGWESEKQPSRQIVVALFKFWAVGSVASVGNNFHKGHGLRHSASPLAHGGPFSRVQPSKRRIAGKDDEGVVMCVEDAQGKSQIENVEEGSVRFRPGSPCLNLSLSTGPPSSLIVPSYLPLPPLESLRHGHELSSVLGRSQNLWLFHL
jgi:hypothetical protein